MTATLHLGDCLEILPTLPDKSINLIACDLPYGTTRNKWDVVIPLAPLWAEYERILTPGGNIVLTGTQPFITTLINSNPGWFRYDLVWDKKITTGFLNANRRPLRRHETILVFYPRLGTYNPQMTPGEFRKKGPRAQTPSYGYFGQADATRTYSARHPTSVIEVSSANRRGKAGDHPTEKPVALMDWIIKTYSNPGDTVLDNAMGSGTTGIAAVTLGRPFIGMELDPGYYTRAQERIERALKDVTYD
jgi:site-specific DNA-methyltransferase (adenine-specific)